MALLHRKTLPFIIIFLMVHHLLNGQIPVKLDHTDCFRIYSENVQDTFLIQVSLPFNYSQSDDRYPVIYLLDSDRMFGMTHDIVHWLRFSREIPDVVVVGIAYNTNWWQKRARDYTPTKDGSKVWGDWPMAGGADNFILFIKNELGPSLEKYRIDATNKTVIGLSAGGIFGNYALFSNPLMFDNYLLVAPGLIWDYEYILKMDNKLEEGINKRIKVFTAMGSLDDEARFIKPWNRMNSLIAEKRYHNLIWEQRLYENQGHISVLPVALTDGLKFLLNE